LPTTKHYHHRHNHQQQQQQQQQLPLQPFSTNMTTTTTTTALSSGSAFTSVQFTFPATAHAQFHSPIAFNTTIITTAPETIASLHFAVPKESLDFGL
jgi:hypothetical protein